MTIQPTILVAIFSVLFSIIGFLATYLLNSILKSQDSLNEKMLTILAKLEGLEIKNMHHTNAIAEIKEELKEKCDRADCKLRA